MILGLATVGAFLVQLPPPLAARTIEQIIVVVDSEPYTLSDLQTYARARTGRQLNTQNLPDLGEADKIILEQFITEKLIASEAERLGIQTTEEDIDYYIQSIKKRNRINEAELTEALSREGMDLQRYRATIRSEITKRNLIERQVKRKVNITPEDVERYYRAHDERFKTDEKVHLRHILLQIPEGATPKIEKETMDRALEIRQRTLDGGAFSQLARTYSEGAGASAGGDIGWVDRRSLLDEIAREAFKLPQGQVSLPVRTSLGLHLLKVESRQPARLLPFAQVEEEIRKELYAKALEERFQRWLKTDLRRKHRVDMKLPGFVFRAEETKEGTVNSLMASSDPIRDDEERGILSYLNPLSYIMSETPIEDETGEILPDQKRVSIFGIPLFDTESADDVEEEPLIQSQESEGIVEPEESKGFFSSVWDSVNPF